MPTQDKRQASLTSEAVQIGNRRWWSENPMAYDWHGEIASGRFSREWFDEIDRRFIEGAKLFATDQQPFDRIIPLDQLRGKRVLEIGCGMGLHTETMTRAGADVTAIDLSKTSVEATSARLRLKGLTATVKEADAEQLPFDDQTFDFIWSWGVIHHSACTAAAIREIARVARPTAEARVMVYNREGMSARIIYWKEHVAKLGFLHRTFDETLYRNSDGFSARFYVAEHFADMFRAYFQNISCSILAQEADVVPLPRQIRHAGLRMVSDSYKQRAQSSRGSFIFVTASCRKD